MNYIGLDTSLSSTGMYILTEDKEYYFNYKNNNKLSKWHKLLNFITYRDYKNVKTDNYSQTEILKLLSYNNITNIIVEDILSVLNEDEIKNTIVITEGYSYSSSNTSSLIDLIGYATLLRIKLLKLPINNFIIKAPSTLKIDTCKYTYPAIEKKIGGKNPRTEYIYKSDERIAGGRFTKREMLKALHDNKLIDIKFKRILDFNVLDLLKMKNIPKPIDDMVDAIHLVWTTKLLD